MSVDVRVRQEDLHDEVPGIAERRGIFPMQKFATIRRFFASLDFWLGNFVGVTRFSGNFPFDFSQDAILPSDTTRAL